MGKNRIVESQELVDTQAILLSLVNVLVYCVLVDGLFAILFSACEYYFHLQR